MCVILANEQELVFLVVYRLCLKLLYILTLQLLLQECFSTLCVVVAVEAC